MGRKASRETQRPDLNTMHFIGDRADGQRDLCVIYIRTVVTTPPREEAPRAARMVAGATPRQHRLRREPESLKVSGLFVLGDLDA